MLVAAGLSPLTGLTWLEPWAGNREPGDLSLRVRPSTTLTGQVTSSAGVTFSICK